jgi:hypothetical protein
MCAHCGNVYTGDSEALTWFQAKACAGSHQVKTYKFAPELKPAKGIEPGTDLDSERPR